MPSPAPAAAAATTNLPVGRDSPGLAKLPLILIAAFLAILALPRARQHEHVVWAFVGVGGALLAWQLVLWRAGRALRVEFVPPIKQHYIQASVQFSLYAYWGWYWSPIYAQIPLIVAQLLYIFAFEALFTWTRGRAWRLTSGPVPIVLSTNLFIWFNDAWFPWQFAMITVGLLGKEFVKWHKEGRHTHIFNPSGFGLLVASVALIATGTTDEATLARPLATTIDGPPHIYLVLFCLGLVVQHFFAVTLMTFAAAAVIVGTNQLYTALTGSHVFAASNLPAAGFLGLHLLMTDPSTSPRTNLGRLLFGAGYGLGYAAMYEVLAQLGNLEIFAKLFPVPVLNLCVRWLDRLGRGGWTGQLNQRWEGALAQPRMNHVHMTMWAALCIPLIATGYLGPQRTDDLIPQWKAAWQAGRPFAEHKFKVVLKCKMDEMDMRGSGDAYNEYALLAMQSPDPVDDVGIPVWLGEGAVFGSLHAARNLVTAWLYGGDEPAPQYRSQALVRLRKAVDKEPGGSDALLLARVFETGSGVPRDVAAALKHYRDRGLGDAFAAKGIARLGLQPGGNLIDLAGVEATLTRAAANGDAEACWYLAHMAAAGRGAVRDEGQARQWLARAAELG
ncbi:MAG: hypothetical protein WAT39_24150, partial [Planctomycetota bacterium]